MQFIAFFGGRHRRTIVITAALMFLTVMCLGTPVAQAAKGGRPHTASSTGNPSLILLNSTDGLAHYGQELTFEVSTTVTARPFVALNCAQDGRDVYSRSVGVFPDYPNQTFLLSSSLWLSGAADCTATAYYFTSNGAERVLGTLDFAVLA